MAWLLGAKGPGILLLLNYVVFGSGLRIELLGGKSNQLFATENRIRQKREWIVPPAVIWEEQDNSRKNPIAKIHSDRAEEKGLIITYTISGPGVTEPPFQLFVINGKTGELNITRIVDREKTPMFHLKGYALDQNGRNLEKPLDLRIKVLDVNDNSPVFSQEIFVGSIEELSAVGTIVMKINATDADDPETLNAKIAFKIVSQEPSFPPAFKINRATGEVWINIANLDREEHSSYSLIVEARDLDGKPNGQSHQAAVQIKVLDVNDNIPVLEKSTYEGSVKENTANVEIMRLKVFDRDEEFTDNWLANFTILSGNEGGHFQIITDSQTNEGILTLVKELNYEELQNIDLKIVVSNKAAYHKSIITQGYQAKPIPVKIKVENVVEGPVFKPQTLVIKTSETMKVNQVIGSFQAFDIDTGKIAQHIRYVKGRDAANWFTIDSKTAEIKLIKIPDYESSFVINGTYYATILAISNDSPAKTATGTIAIQVEDVNDHCPVLVSPITTVCSDAKFINITAKDQDPHPNGGPFTFTIIDDPERMSHKWIISQLDGSRAQLIPQDLQPGRYEIPLLVKDNQGLSCPDQQILKVHICECAVGGGCREKIIGSSVILGPTAIALMILALLLLLLVPLLLLACGLGSRGIKGFAAIPEHSEEMLRNWNSEGAAPEDKAIPTLITPSTLDMGTRMGAGGAAGAAAGAAAGSRTDAVTVSGGYSSVTKEHYVKSVDGRWEEQSPLLSATSHAGMGMGMTTTMDGGGGLTVGSRRAVTMETGGVINEEFLRDYFSEKADAFAEDDEALLAKDCLLIYSQEEEKGSLHGSVGCCSFIEGDFDDHFLDDLGDKFKTLAEICMGKHAGLETGTHSSHVPKDGGPRPSMNESNLQYLHQQSANHIFASNSSYQQPEPVKSFGSETMMETVTETAVTSRPGLQQVKPIADPVISSSNVVVTETTYGAIPPMITRDPPMKENVVVTERIFAPAANLQDRLEMPTGVFPDLPDSKYVVVRERERVLIPSSELKPSLSNPNLVEEQNGVMTERVVTTTPGMWSTAEPSSNDRQEHVLISDPLFSQGSAKEPLSAGSTLSKSSQVKYSSVQYTRS